MDHFDFDAPDGVYEVKENGERVLVRSTESTQRVYLRFTNLTTRPTDVWWLDFRGFRRHYLTLQPGGCRNLNSFVTHPWAFTDGTTGEQYVINNKPIFRAPKDIGGMTHRTNWNITIGVRTLRYTAMLSLATYVRDPSAVDLFGLPRILAEELRQLIDSFHRPLLNNRAAEVQNSVGQPEPQQYDG